MLYISVSVVVFVVYFKSTYLEKEKAYTRERERKENSENTESLNYLLIFAIANRITHNIPICLKIRVLSFVQMCSHIMNIQRWKNVKKSI